MSEHVQDVLFKPRAEWTVPDRLPDLSGVQEVGLDFESRDPRLLSRGPGFIRQDAQVCGVAVATRDAAWYLPVQHPSTENYSRAVIAEWLQVHVAARGKLIVGANLSYELECLWSLGVSCDAELFDVQLASALIDEEHPEGHSLEAISRRTLNRGKDESLLREAAEAYGIDPKKDIWKLPAKYVGRYAEQDAQLALLIADKQRDELLRQGLEDIMRLESKLQPIIWKMRLKGIPVDLDQAEILATRLEQQEEQMRDSLYREYGSKLDPWSGPCLAAMCDELQVDYPETAKGNPSFTKEFLERSEHPLLKTVREIRQLNRLRKTFVHDWIFENQVHGRVHPCWKQLASDEGGTRTGRLAASNPNPQQVPGRSDLALLVRKLFVPEDGLKWAKLDYSQQEPRILVHFAALCKFSGANGAVESYVRDANMDFYQFMVEAAGVDRRTAKDLYLGRCYNMGAGKMAEKMGCSEDEARQILENFDRHVPFVKRMAEYSDSLAQKRGWVKTLLGRKRHFNLWESTNRSKVGCFPEEIARARIDGPIRRAFTHKALNALIQGSAADMTKAAMLRVHDELGLVPYMQVHDELNYGVESQKQASEVKRCMEECVEMLVPVKTDLSYGDHWK